MPLTAEAENSDDVTKNWSLAWIWMSFEFA